MGKIQIILLIVLAVILLTVMILTWGSIGSILMGFCLFSMGAAVLYRYFLIDRDSDDFQADL